MTTSLARVLKMTLAIVFFLAFAVCAAAVYFIGPRNLIGMWRYDQRNEGSLKVGDHAPDVTLAGLYGATEVHLRDHVGSKPLVLIFGSYT